MGHHSVPSTAPPSDAATPLPNRSTSRSPQQSSPAVSLTSSESPAGPLSPSITPSPSRSSASTPCPSPKISPPTARSRPPPPGLFNLGNTCYLNSVVQVLYHIPSFRNAILSFTSEDIDEERLPGQDFACDVVASLRTVFQSLDDAYDTAVRQHENPSPPPSYLNGVRSSARSQTDAAEDPRSTLSALEDEPPLREGVDYVAPQCIIDLLRDHERCVEFDARGQQDAHEFLRFLLDKVNDCMQMIVEEGDPSDIVKEGSAGNYERRSVADGAGSSVLPHEASRAERSSYRSVPEGDRGALNGGPTDGTMGSSSTSAGLTTPTADAEHEGSNPSFSNSEGKPADKTSPLGENGKSEAGLRGSSQALQDLKRGDVVPGSSVQAPISSKTTGECVGGALDPTATVRHHTVEQDSGPVGFSTTSSHCREVSSQSAAEHKEDSQKSPLAKRRKRELEGAAQSAAGPNEENGHGAVGAGIANNEEHFVKAKRRPGALTNLRPTKRYRKKLVQDLFEGDAVTATMCYECESQSDRRETFLDISLPVEQEKKMDWALSTQCAEEQLLGRDKYHCDKCMSYTEAKRWWQIASVPEVLTVHLKLFAYSMSLNMPGGKVSVAMPCPTRTRLAQWCTSKCSQREDEYKLTAVIVHEGGTANSGHYYSYICTAEPEAQWYCFDDSYVALASEEEVKERLFSQIKSRRTAYLLFYTNSRDLEVKSC